jgi:SET domain-containing protein
MGNNAKKQRLLASLRKDVYCRVMPSPLSGVGVFAIRDIPKDTDPFKNTTGRCPKYDIVELVDEDVKTLHPEVRKMLKDFCKNDKVYDVPYLGLNSLDITFYMNHSNQPNMQLVEEEGCEYITFRTKRTIKQGEELLLDYRQYLD